MSTQWYYAINGERGGPISAGELKALADQGRLRPDDLIWKEGMSEWCPARVAKGLFPAQPARPSSPSPAPSPSGPSPSGLWDDLDGAPKAQVSHSASNELFEPVAEPTHRAYQAPRSPVGEQSTRSRKVDVEKVKQIRVVLMAAVFFNFVLGVFWRLVDESSVGLILGLFLLSLIDLIVYLIYAFRFFSRLYGNVAAVLLTIIGIIPLVAIICVLVANSKIKKLESR